MADQITKYKSFLLYEMYGEIFKVRKSGVGVLPGCVVDQICEDSSQGFPLIVAESLTITRGGEDDSLCDTTAGKV